MNLGKQIQQLEQIRGVGANKVLSMYLNTDPADPDQQGGKWKINLKNGLRNFDKYLQESNDPEEIANFRKVREKVLAYIEENELDLKKGMILFATADDSIWFAAKVQVRVKTDFYWQENLVLDQLKQIKREYPKSGIILVQHNQVKIIESNLNEIEDTVHYELDFLTEEWKKRKQPQKLQTLDNPHQGDPDLFMERTEANMKRWYRNLAPKLDRMAKEQDWEKIIVMGEADAANTLLELMNKPVDALIQKNLFYQEERKVLNEVFK